MELKTSSIIGGVNEVRSDGAQCCMNNVCIYSQKKTRCCKYNHSSSESLREAQRDLLLRSHSDELHTGEGSVGGGGEGGGAITRKPADSNEMSGRLPATFSGDRTGVFNEMETNVWLRLW